MPLVFKTAQKILVVLQIKLFKGKEDFHLALAEPKSFATVVMLIKNTAD